MEKKTFKNVVIMGDLVQSRKVSDVARLHRGFNSVLQKINDRYAPQIISPLTITLGDEFQGLVSSLEVGFQIVEDTRLQLLEKGIEGRFIVGLAFIQTPLNRDKAWNMMGVGLSETRTKLNDKNEFNCYRFSLETLNEELELLLDGAGRTLTKVEQEWTSTQRRYVSFVLRHPEKTKNEMAHHLKISANTLFKVLRSAHAQFYFQQIETVAKALRLIDRRMGFE